jgi:hypothetical protein
LAHPALGWDAAMLRRVWTAAIIMHNMIVEDNQTRGARSHKR